MMAITIDVLTHKGYEVAVAHPRTDQTGAIYSVSGFGVRAYVSVDDQDQLDALAAAARPEPVIALADARNRKSAEVLAALRTSDQWAARAVEEGIAMAPDRVAYRRDLRALLATISGRSTAGEVEAIPLPPLPANP